MKTSHLLLLSASGVSLVALWTSILSVSRLKNEDKASLPANGNPDHKDISIAGIPSALQQFETKNPPRRLLSQYASLDCSKTETKGPSLLEAAEMVYWRDRSDASLDPAVPSTYSGGYLTFEPDGGGWNNIRMAMETIVALAIAMNRTLVLPAEQRMYLLGKDRGKHKTDFSFKDFFPMENLQELRVISMQEFLEQHAMKGKMRYRSHITEHAGEVAFPPGNRTDWNGQDVKILKEWLRNVTETPRWSPSKCLAVFPVDHSHIATLQSMHQDILQNDLLRANEIDPPDLQTITTKSRLREHLAQRRELCVYDSQAESVLHFMCSHKDRVRMLVHFYAFVFFENVANDFWLKRFVRDHLRYVDEIQCAAARIVALLRHESKTGVFDTMHVRRGDFQYKNTRIDAKEILKNVQDVIPRNATVYIATDERQKEFFQPLKEYYRVKFLDDYKDVLGSVNKNFYGMIDQLVAARGRNFFGCWHSTFTGYIMRLRGYHAAKEKLPGFLDGVLPSSYYYVPTNVRTVMHKYAPLQGAFFNREFPTAWRQLDYDLNLHHRDVAVQ